MLKKSLPIFLALAALILMNGCHNATLPPGFERVGGVLQNKTSVAASPEAVFSLMEWYRQANAENEVPPLWNDYVTQQRKKAVADMNEQWQKGLINRSGALFVADPQTFIDIDPTVLASRTNWDGIKHQLHNLKVIIQAPRTFQIPVTEATDDSFWVKINPSQREAFTTWAHRRTLTPPDPKGLDRDHIVRQLDRIQAAVTVKMHIVTAIEKANKLTAKHHYFEALDLLHQTAKTYAPNDQALSALQDTHTIPMLRETMNLVPFTCIGQTLTDAQNVIRQAQERTKRAFDPAKNSVQALDELLADLETRLSTEINHWNKDSRCQDALRKNQKELHTLIAQLARLRETCWNYCLTQHFKNITYREAMDKLRECLHVLNIPDHRQFNLYALEKTAPQSDVTFSQLLAQQLRKHFTSHLPQALEVISDAADMALNVNRKPGFALALGFLARQMAQQAKAQDNPDVKAKLDKLNLVYTQAEKIIRDTILKRVVAISDMSSAVPGLGLTYTQDVIHALDRLLRAFKIDDLVTIAKTTVPMTRYSYSLFDGVVADFDGKETIERQNVRIVRRFGEIKKSSNPEYQEDNTKPPHIFTQEVYEQLINVREIERLAHVRAFINMRGPGFTTLVEVNEFYSKRFIIEDSHPFNDLRVTDVLKTYDLAKHPVQDAIPALTYDRVWTPGEMLDWARKDSLRVFTLKLIFHINQFPFLLENQARNFERDGNLPETTEFWAYCFALTERINPDAANYSNILNDTSKPAAKCYEQCIADLRKQRNDIVELKKNAHDMMTVKASRQLHRLKKK